MQEFSLELKAPIKGIYLNTETIELLSIIQCKNIKELKNFAINCPQLNISEKDLINWGESNIDDIKRNLVEQYKDSLVPLKQSIKSFESVIKSILQHLEIADEEIDSYISVFQNDGYEGIKQKLKTDYPESYAIFAEKAHRFITTERDQMKNVTFEELSGINDILSNYNTILIGSGSYCDIVDKMYDIQISDMEKYDFEYPRRSLEFCYRNQMNARYHTLLDKHTLEDFLVGKSKKDIIKELKEYVKHSIDFISNYNEKHKINGKGVICSVDLFNEIISFDEPYKNIWKETFGISTEELMGVFQYAKDNKPDGVTYVYNEPFLENPERRQAVLEQLNELPHGLIDTLGTQMHIEMNQNIDDIRQCFNDLKKLESLGIGIQITEFDMCLPEKFMFDENGKIRSEKELVDIINSKGSFTIESMAEFKKIKICEISKAIEETGIQLDGITYWSISDILDHNLERINKKTYETDSPRDIAQTRYSGLYSNLGGNKTLSSSISMQAVVSNAITQGISTEDVEKSDIAEYKKLQENQIGGLNRND